MNNNEHIPFLMLLVSGFGTMAHSWCEQCHESEAHISQGPRLSGSQLADGVQMKASSQNQDLSMGHGTGVE